MRTLLAAVVAQLRILSLAPMSMVTSYLTPLALAVLITALSDRPTAALIVGTAAASVWNTLLIQAFLIVTQERQWRTMEVMAATPSGFTAGLFGRLLGALLQALVTVPLTAGLILLAGGIPSLRPWTLLTLCFLVILAGLSGAALLHMALVIRHRSYAAFINGAFPLSIALMGLFVPTDRMPYGIGQAGRLFAATWAMEAIRDGSWRPLLTGAAIAAATMALAIWYLSRIRRWLRHSPSALQI